MIGAISIVLWGALALLTRLTGGDVPPFQLLAMTFTLAFMTMVISWIWRWRSPLRYLRQPWLVWVNGVGGLAGFHLLYFIAQTHAPAVSVSLIAYLWPLLIVLFSALLPGESFRAGHLAGALLAFAGCALLIGGDSFQSEYMIGYLSAFGCALIWSGYSVISRLFSAVPTDTVGWFCGVTAVLAWCIHLLIETTVWPQQWIAWLGVLGLGLGPVGIAFFTWDYGVKHGNLQLLGVLAYGAPLLSVLLLIAADMAEPELNLLLACIAIVVGALLAARASRAAC
ncbi:MAG: EamA family transporter [Marinobacterium sp.]|nr:EamA family transporter [Marinobacterium sp.]